MCLPQDPVSRGLTKIDPIAKIDGRRKLSEQYGEKMDPLGSAITRKDPIAKSLKFSDRQGSGW